MHGDFSRWSFDPSRHFSSVLFQQGRVQLDADINEQAAILLHFMRTLAADLIGPYGGPAPEPGFKIAPMQRNGKLEDLAIGIGRYYVSGMLCEAQAPADAKPGEPPLRYLLQYALPRNSTTALEEQELPLLVYLDVWERLITAAEAPDIRDPALGANGPDTAARRQVVWQVRTSNKLDKLQIAGDNADEIRASIHQNWQAWVDDQHPPLRGLLQARSDPGPIDESDVCTLSPEARYRGRENQLYRVEIHHGGSEGSATFKWSRDNGAIVFPILDASAATLTLATLGRDAASTLHPGDWVELVDPPTTLWGQPGPLWQIKEVDPLDLRVTLKERENFSLPTPASGALLRRWDHQEGDPRRGDPELDKDSGSLKLKEGAWVTLEQGVQIMFTAEKAPERPRAEDGAVRADAPVAIYRPGDYWLIPARSGIGDVLWPDGIQAERPPEGIQHAYAPLALIQGLAENQTLDLRFVFASQASQI
jgi:hypothetical protein